MGETHLKTVWEHPFLKNIFPVLVLSVEAFKHQRVYYSPTVSSFFLCELLLLAQNKCFCPKNGCPDSSSVCSKGSAFHWPSFYFGSEEVKYVHAKF